MDKQRKTHVPDPKLLKETRRKAGVGLRELAKRAGIPQSTLGAIEGERFAFSAQYMKLWDVLETLKAEKEAAKKLEKTQEDDRSVPLNDSTRWVIGGERVPAGQPDLGKFVARKRAENEIAQLELAAKAGLERSDIESFESAADRAIADDGVITEKAALKEWRILKTLDRIIRGRKDRHGWGSYDDTFEYWGGDTEFKESEPLPAQDRASGYMAMASMVNPALRASLDEAYDHRLKIKQDPWFLAEAYQKTAKSLGDKLNAVGRESFIKDKLIASYEESISAYKEGIVELEAENAALKAKQPK